jgi:hypothetical protein
MRKLKTSDITTSVSMPIKSGTLDHIQAAYSEAVAEAVKALVGTAYSNTTMYILNGLVNSGSFPTYTISAGSVFYNGEVYLVDAVSFAVAGAQFAVCKIVTTNLTGTNADAVQFSDGIPRNVHEIRKVVISADLGGSGISNYVDGQRINANIPQANLSAGTGISITGAYPNQTISSTITNKIIRTGKIAIGDLNVAPSDPNTALLAGSTSGLSAYVHTFPSALADANYKPILILGNDGHSDWGGFNNNFMCVLQTGAYSNTQMYFAIGTTASGSTQSIDVNYVLISTV